MKDVRTILAGAYIVLATMLVTYWLSVGLHNQEPTAEGFDFSKKEDVQAFLQQFERIE